MNCLGPWYHCSFWNFSNMKTSIRVALEVASHQLLLHWNKELVYVYCPFSGTYKVYFDYWTGKTTGRRHWGLIWKGTRKQLPKWTSHPLQPWWTSLYRFFLWSPVHLKTRCKVSVDHLHGVYPRGFIRGTIHGLLQRVMWDFPYIHSICLQLYWCYQMQFVAVVDYGIKIIFVLGKFFGLLLPQTYSPGLV